MHSAPILITLTCALLVALILGALCHRLRLSPILGYLLAGFLVGPQTPGFVADRHVTEQFAEIGIILLMFGVGLEFHLEDLQRVRRIAVPGALAQVAVAVLATAGLAAWSGWPWHAGVILGIAVSVASTVVLVRTLEEHGTLQTLPGRTAIGWLVVEDVLTVLIVVLLPAAQKAANSQGLADLGIALGTSLLRVFVLVVLTLGLGRQIVPRALHWVAGTRSRELFTLTVLAIALGVATGSAVFLHVSVALGAFLAGMVVGQSEVSHRAAADALPLRDAFAVLFFVSVGMRLEWQAVFEHCWLILAVVAVIVVIKPLTAFLVIVLLRGSMPTALAVGAALGQIGEFSFILSDMAQQLGLVPAYTGSVLVVAAVVSIGLNPGLFACVGPLERTLKRFSHDRTAPEAFGDREPRPAAQAVVVGYGPAGRVLCRILEAFAIEPVVIDLNLDAVRELRARRLGAIHGDASRRAILEAAGVETARYLLVTIPDRQSRNQVLHEALALNPKLKVLVRARFVLEKEELDRLGVTIRAFEEEEVAVALASRFLHEIGEPDVDESLERIRRRILQDGEAP